MFTLGNFKFFLMVSQAILKQFVALQPALTLIMFFYEMLIYLFIILMKESIESSKIFYLSKLEF